VAGLQGDSGAQGPVGPQGSAGPTGNNGTNGAGFNFLGIYNPTASYAANDVVTFAATTTTYNVNLTFSHTACSQGYNCTPGTGSGSAVGTITTNGKIGALHASDIVSFNLTLNDGSHIGVLTPPNAVIADNFGSGMSATATTMSFDFGTYGTQFSFQSTANSPTGQIGQLCLTDNSNCLPAMPAAGMWGIGGNNLWIWSNPSGVQIIATGGTVNTGTSTYIATGPAAAGIAPGAAPWVMMAQAGANGTNGTPGTNGTNGTNGIDGVSIQGPAGSTGATGATGAASTVPGPTGPQGPAGATGTTGLASTVPGPTGPAGAQGAVGPAGVNGTGFNFTGPWSLTNNYKVNDVATFGGTTYVAVLANTNQEPDLTSVPVSSSTNLTFTVTDQLDTITFVLPQSTVAKPWSYPNGIPGMVDGKSASALLIDFGNGYNGSPLEFTIQNGYGGEQWQIPLTQPIFTGDATVWPMVPLTLIPGTYSSAAITACIGCGGGQISIGPYPGTVVVSPVSDVYWNVMAQAGANGTNGLDGINAVGIQGPIGPQGIQGIQGIQGPAGPAGSGSGGSGTPNPFTAASIMGTYTLLMQNTHIKSWQSTPVSCINVNGQPQQYTAGGSSMTREFEFGTLTFDGVSSVSGTMTQHHVFDQAASNASATVSCNAPGTQPTINNGHVVYDPDTVSTGAIGSYVAGNGDGPGTGRWYFNGDGTSYMRLEIGGPPATASGPWTTILIFEWTGGGADGMCGDCGSGTAVLQQ
jgi:hypothetical protein